MLTAVAVFAFGFANAQEIKTDAGTFRKPVAGTVIMELNFSPDLSGGNIFSLPTFAEDLNKASGNEGGLVGIKARKFVSESKAYRAIANITVTNSGQEDAPTDFAVAVGFGIENHLKGAERLSTYWGYQGSLGYVSATNETTNFETKVIGFQADLFTGFDYYIIPNVYLGAEISYGVAVTNTKVEDFDGVTGLKFAPGIAPSIRLGWSF